MGFLLKNENQQITDPYMFRKDLSKKLRAHRKTAPGRGGGFVPGGINVDRCGSPRHPAPPGILESKVYHNFRQLWLVLGVKLMEINSNLFSRMFFLF